MSMRRLWLWVCFWIVVCLIAVSPIGGWLMLVGFLAGVTYRHLAELVIFPARWMAAMVGLPSWDRSQGVMFVFLITAVLLGALLVWLCAKAAVLGRRKRWHEARLQMSCAVHLIGVSAALALSSRHWDGVVP